MLVTFEQAKKYIEEGKILHIAGHCSVLSKLPKGNWIGGTTQLFIADEGGTFSREKLFVNIFDFPINFKVKVYNKSNIFDLIDDSYKNGLNLMVLPAETELTTYYSKESMLREDLLFHPTVGWIAGRWNDEPTSYCRVYDGTTGKSYEQEAVVMFMELPPGKTALIDIVNIFDYDDRAPIITFPTEGNIVTDCFVNGEKKNFAEYVKEAGLDIKLPIMADCNGVYLNSSIREIAGNETHFYTPVQRGLNYRPAKPLENYAAKFAERIASARKGSPIFACNCLMNYLYGDLEGKKLPPYEGPITYGEIAYRVLSQTLVYCEIV